MAKIDVNTHPARPMNHKSQNRVFGNATFFSWKSVFAGSVIALISFFLLSVLGVAIGATAFNVGEVSGSSYGWGSAIWMILTTVIALFIGGYVASRLSNYVNSSVGMAQGLTIAALFFAFTFWQAGSAVSSLGQGVFGAVSSTVRGASGAAGNAIQNPMVQNVMERALDRSNIEIKGDPSVVAQGVASRLLAGDTEAAQAYLARNSNIPAQQADERIQGAMGTLQSELKTAVNGLADAAAALAWSVFVLMILGLGAGLMGGVVGARENIKHPLVREERRALGTMQPARV